MADATTEQLNELAQGLDTLGSNAILTILHKGQMAAAGAVADSIPAIEKAAELLAATLSGGGNIIYAAAGSSALMAMADGLELPGTFGIDNDRLKILIAGGTGSLLNMAGKTEDDTDQAIAHIGSAKVRSGDCLICVSASGTTPYAVGAMHTAKQAGAKIVAIANNPDTPLMNDADIAICLETPPEIISGSTRLGAGTAQKICLNMISTLMAVHLGHVHDGYMVNVRADNTKLKKRAAGIVAAIVDCRLNEAQKYLNIAGGSIKHAVLIASGASDTKTATDIPERNGQKLRPSLSVLNGATAPKPQSA